MNIEIFENKIFTLNESAGDDAITAFGSTFPDLGKDKTIIKNCIIDLSKVPLNKQDEAISGVCGAVVEVYNTLIVGSIKAVLAGNSDYPIQDIKHGGWKFDKCVFLGCGRRCPEAQDGVLVHITNSWIHDWCNNDFFDTRGFGGYAHRRATIIAENCIFTQPKFFKLSLKNQILDFANHFGQAWNDNPSYLRDYFLPGVCRGLTASNGGYASAINYYKNKWWICIDNAEYELSWGQALEIIRDIQSSLNPQYSLYTPGNLCLEDLFQKVT